VGSGDASALDGAIQRFTTRHGPAHGVVDFTAVSSVSVPVGKLVPQPSNIPGYKWIVVANSDLADLARTTARASTIVSSVEEALRALGATDSSFEPVDPP
jgi:hypothetical protein